MMQCGGLQSTGSAGTGGAWLGVTGVGAIGCRQGDDLPSGLLGRAFLLSLGDDEGMVEFVFWVVVAAMTSGRMMLCELAGGAVWRSRPNFFLCHPSTQLGTGVDGAAGAGESHRAGFYQRCD